MNHVLVKWVLIKHLVLNKLLRLHIKQMTNMVIKQILLLKPVKMPNGILNTVILTD